MDKEVVKDSEANEETVKDLVATFKSTVEAIASRPVNVTIEDPRSKIDPAVAAKTRQAELQVKYGDIKTQANELAAAGDTAGALELMYGFVQEQAQSNRPEGDDPAIKSLVSMGEKLAKQTYAREFEKYGDELKAYVSKLSPEKKINPDVWEEAVGAVRTQHFDEFLEDAIKEREENQRSVQGGAPFAPGSRGRRSESSSSDEDADLTDDERGVAKSFGMSPEDYAKQRAQIAKTRKRDYFPLLEDSDTPDKIEPGRF